MFSASATRDELTGTFRSLSQKRRHGVLSIAWGEQVFTISFYNGKIVDVESSSVAKPEAIIKKLVLGKTITETTARMLETSAPTIAELYEQAVKGGFISDEQFVRAKVSVEMNLLYSLRAMGIGQIEFIPRIIHVDSHFGLNVSPGQLLLDMVELDTEEKKFEALFAENERAPVKIALKQTERGTLNPEELEILRVSEQVKTCLSDIRDRALLTEYELRQALLSLVEKSYLQFGTLGQEPKATSVKAVAIEATRETRQTEESQIDDAADELEGITEPEGGDEVSLAAAEISRFDSGEIAASSDEFDPDLDCDDHNPVLTVGKMNLQEDELEEEDFVSSPLLNGGLAASHSRKDVVRNVKISNRLLHFSSMLLQPQMVSVLSLILNIAFLIALAIFVPTLIDGWFRALSALAPEI